MFTDRKTKPNPVIYVPIRHLYICRESSTNSPLLCKTNPIFPTYAPKTTIPKKTNPIQTQFQRPLSLPLPLWGRRIPIQTQFLLPFATFCNFLQISADHYLIYFNNLRICRKNLHIFCEILLANIFSARQNTNSQNKDANVHHARLHT